MYYDTDLENLSVYLHIYTLLDIQRIWGEIFLQPQQDSAINILEPVSSTAINSFVTVNRNNLWTHPARPNIHHSCILTQPFPRDKALSHALSHLILT